MNNHKIQELKDKYRESFTAKSDILASLILPLSSLWPDSFTSDLQVRQEVEEYLHKLAGSSGMYGYPEIEQSARAALKSSETGDLGGLKDHLNHLLGLLRQYAKG